MLLILLQLPHAQSGKINLFFQNQHCLQGNEMKSRKIKKTIIQPKIPACNKKIRRAAAAGE